MGAAIIAWDSAANPRVLAMSACVAVWGVRLTYNFYHRRGYDQVLRGRIWAGEEDHRWAVARTLPVLNTRVGWFALNLVFISIIQVSDYPQILSGTEAIVFLNATQTRG